MNQFSTQEVERLINTYSDMVLRLSFSYLKSIADAEDICQTVFLKLMTTGAVFDSPAHEKAYIIRATINACKNELKAFRRKLVSIDEMTDLGDYTFIVRDAVFDQNNVGVVTFEIENPNGHGYDEEGRWLGDKMPAITWRLTDSDGNQMDGVPSADRDSYSDTHIAFIYYTTPPFQISLVYIPSSIDAEIASSKAHTMLNTRSAWFMHVPPTG